MIVTACDADFLPGLRALVNSIRIHSPGMPVACFTYGDDELEAEARSICDAVIHNYSVADYLPPGEGTDKNCHPMYVRLIAPQTFDQCIWMDADQVVMRDMQPLLDMEFDQPVAAVRANYNTRRSVRNIDTHDEPGIFSGLMVFNTHVWRERKLTERCFEIMRDEDAFFRFVVQSVMNIALEGDFLQLDPRWQGFGNRDGLKPENYWVLHWHGRFKKPWTHPDMPNADKWREYECESS